MDSELYHNLNHFFPDSDLNVDARNDFTTESPRRSIPAGVIAADL